MLNKGNFTCSFVGLKGGMCGGLWSMHPSWLGPLCTPLSEIRPVETVQLWQDMYSDVMCPLRLTVTESIGSFFSKFVVSHHLLLWVDGMSSAPLPFPLP